MSAFKDAFQTGLGAFILASRGMEKDLKKFKEAGETFCNEAKGFMRERNQEYMKCDNKFVAEVARGFEDFGLRMEKAFDELEKSRKEESREPDEASEKEEKKP